MSYNKKSTKTSRESSGMGMKILAFILAIVVIAGCTFGGLELWGKGKQKPSSWGKDDTAVVQPNDPDEEQPPHEDASESHGIRLMAAKIPIKMYESYGIAPASVESAYTITATIEPDNATVKDVDWSVYFKNDASEWATGKTVTDYVTISPTAASCVVTCAQAFGEPIMVKVASHEDSSIFATKQFDYVKRLNSKLTVKAVNESYPDAMQQLVIGTDPTAYVKIDNTFNNNIGTIEGTITIPKITVKIKDSPLLQEIKNQFVINLNTYPGLASSDYTLDYNENDYIMINPETHGNAVIPWTAFFAVDGGNDFNKVSEKAKNILKSAVIKAVKKCNTTNTYNALSFSVNVKNTYKNATIEELTVNFTYFGADVSSLVVNITDLKFEDSGDLYF